MKTFIISMVTLFIIVASITTYVFFLKFTISDFENQIDEIFAAEAVDDWNKVSTSFNKLSSIWQSKVKIIEVFTNHNKTDEISRLLIQMKNHINNSDKKQLQITTDILLTTLKFLYDNEIPTLENVV